MAGVRIIASVSKWVGWANAIVVTPVVAFNWLIMLGDATARNQNILSPALSVILQVLMALFSSVLYFAVWALLTVLIDIRDQLAHQSLAPDRSTSGPAPAP